MSSQAEQIIAEFKRLSPQDRCDVQAAILAFAPQARDVLSDPSVSDIDAVRSKKPRPYGLDKGKFVLSASFFEPLPDDLIAAFEGGENDPLSRVRG